MLKTLQRDSLIPSQIHPRQYAPIAPAQEAFSACPRPDFPTLVNIDCTQISSLGVFTRAILP
jgi:hypothetical protein